MKLDDLNKLIRPVRLMVVNLFARAVLTKADDSQKMQIVQLALTDDETREDLERPQNYGFTSVPFEDAEAFVAFPGGRRDHGVVLVVDDRRYRLKSLQTGEVAMYTDEGDSITIKRGGTVVVNARNVELAGSDQFVALAQKTLDELTKLKTAYDAHTHVIPALSVVGAATSVSATGAGPSSPALSSPASSKVKAGL